MRQVIKKYNKTLISISSLIFFFLAWELSLNIFEVSKTVLIKPSEILNTCITDYDILSKEMIYSAKEILPGWLIGNALGFLAALSIYRKDRIAKRLVNVSVLVNSIPLITLAAVLGGIVGTNQNQKILLVSLITFFPTFITTLSELTNIDEGHKDLLLSYNSSEKQILKKVLLPKSLPSILNSVKVTVTTAIFTAITAEFFGGYGGIGIFILSKKGLYNLKLVWAGIFFIALFGSLFYSTVQLLQKRLVRWQKS